MDQHHALSQEDIDALFQSKAGGNSAAQRAFNARAYDFRRTDRIPKEQIRALRTVHDTFARSLATSLSAYLRSYVTVNLISVEQLSFLEFVNCLPSPTCLTTLGMHPFDALGLLEINLSLAFPLIEILLGGGKVKPIAIMREMTTIEQRILDGLLLMILQNLASSWQSVATVDFSIEGHETEPGLLRVLGPNEAIVVIATEIQIGETSGMMNIGVPSSIVKVLRQKFEQQWGSRKNATADDESARILNLIKPAGVRLEARLHGSTVTVEDLIKLKQGDILQFTRSVHDPVQLLVNGMPKFRGQIVANGRRKALAVQGLD